MDTKSPTPSPPAPAKAVVRAQQTKRASELSQANALMLPQSDPLMLNRTTGYLEASRLTAFSSLKKVKFLQLYRLHPNASACAKAVGVTPRTVSYHLDRDEAFQGAFNEVREEMADELEAKVYEFAQRPQNFLDRIAFLKAFRPERWNPEYKIEIKRDSIITEKLLLGAEKIFHDSAHPQE